MPRYVDADEVKKAIEESWDGCLGAYDSHEITMNDLWVIDKVQTVNVRKNVHAHWEDWSFLGWDMETHWRRRCSNCLCEREDDNEENDTLFCPNCGARMNEGKEDVEETD